MYFFNEQGVLTREVQPEELARFGFRDLRYAQNWAVGASLAFRSWKTNRGSVGYTLYDPNQPLRKVKVTGPDEHDCLCHLLRVASHVA